MTGVRSSRRGWLAAALGVSAIALLLPFTIFLVSSWLLGWQLQHVQSSSMAPTYPVGALLVVGQIDAARVEPGMAIVFEDPAKRGRLVTHRVVRIVPGDALQFITQGDANASADALPVPARFVRGRVLWSVSHLGVVLDWLQWPRSFVLLVVAPGLALLAFELRDRRAASGREARGAVDRADALPMAEHPAAREAASQAVESAEQERRGRFVEVGEDIATTAANETEARERSYAAEADARARHEAESTAK